MCPQQGIKTWAEELALEKSRRVERAGKDGASVTRGL